MSKTALITGASRGIGASIARIFSQNGFNVIINYCNSEKNAINLENELNNKYSNIKAKAIKADVSDEKQVDFLFSQAEKEFGFIDVLINNAGIAEQKMLCDATKYDFDKLMNTNVGSVFLCSKQALKSMVAKKQGKIINVSSIWGITGASCEVLYSASKAAIIGFTKALAKEVGPSGITVNCIAPGVIDTDMNSNLTEDDLNSLKDETPLCRIGKCEDIANVALFLASEKADFITGQVISPNGGFLI